MQDETRVHAFMRQLCFECLANKTQRELGRSPECSGNWCHGEEAPTGGAVSSLALWRFRLEGLLLGGKAKMDPGGGAVHPETKWGSESLWARKSSRDLLGSDLVSQLSKLCEPPSPAPAHSWHRDPPAYQELLGSYSQRVLE